FPSDFDPSRLYPVIDMIYPGPFNVRTPKAAFRPKEQIYSVWDLLSMAEVGFIVVTIDGLGTAFRSKQFQDFSYRNLQDAGLPDHVAVIRQLAAERPYMDLDRVAIEGFSAGGGAAMRALLEFPDFYCAAVA